MCSKSAGSLTLWCDTVADSGNQMGHYSSSPLQHMGGGGLNHRPLTQHSPHRDNRMPPGNSGPPGTVRPPTQPLYSPPMLS